MTDRVGTIALVLLIPLLFLLSCQSLKNKRNTMNLPVEELPNTSVTYGVAYLNVIPLRKEPSHRSEFVSQVLFAEYVQILKTENEWSFIRLEQDSYEGWVESSQLKFISKESYDKFHNTEKVKFTDEFTTIYIDNKKLILLKGSNLPFYEKASFGLVDERFEITANVSQGKCNRESIVKTALSYLNTPYLWGGKTPMGVDCSGFSQMVYHINGYDIMRDASQQATQGELVPFLEQAKPGDLAFFDNKEGHITHVGIILEEGKIIHAAHGKVHIDKIDQEGIFNLDEQKYSHHLRMVRKYLD